ncbi:hypothetical protein L9F63_005345, partial [Diploptera punctata]
EMASFKAPGFIRTNSLGHLLVHLFSIDAPLSSPISSRSLYKMDNLGKYRHQLFRFGFSNR